MSAALDCGKVLVAIDDSKARADKLESMPGGSRSEVDGYNVCPGTVCNVTMLWGGSSQGAAATRTGSGDARADAKGVR